MTWSSPNINSNGLYPNSTTVPAWGSLFTSTADALAQQEPALLFLAEGTGQRNQPGTAYGTLLIPAILCLCFFYYPSLCFLSGTTCCDNYRQSPSNICDYTQSSQACHLTDCLCNACLKSLTVVPLYYRHGLWHQHQHLHRC